eukprot:GHVT01082589.1.p2 GENE.GHVT01082589.1~~GHVT01082589.1.p2  ORF type:complete len:145 (+),score=6.47 GHVT01082589.1:125-559(+)
MDTMCEEGSNSSSDVSIGTTENPFRTLSSISYFMTAETDSHLPISNSSIPPCAAEGHTVRPASGLLDSHSPNTQSQPPVGHQLPTSIPYCRRRYAPPRNAFTLTSLEASRSPALRYAANVARLRERRRARLQSSSNAQIHRNRL